MVDQFGPLLLPLVPPPRVNLVHCINTGPLTVYHTFLQVSCLSIMLRQDELAFIKAHSTMQTSPVLLKDLRTALASSKKKRKTVVSAGSRGTTLSGAPKASQHPSSLSAGKRKANELVSSGDSTQPANWRPAPGAGCAPLPAFTSVTSEQVA
jgi:hypothetical protein